MDSNSILRSHFVELIDAADTVISEHESTSFDAELTCLVIFAHGCGQTSGVRGFTTTVDGAGEELADVLEEEDPGFQGIHQVQQKSFRTIKTQQQIII